MNTVLVLVGLIVMSFALDKSRLLDYLARFRMLLR